MTREERDSKWKRLTEQIIDARRRGHDFIAAELSRRRQKLKKYQFCHWPGCDVPVRGYHCMMHDRAYKWYSRRLAG